jgi:hypothetical protein
MAITQFSPLAKGKAKDTIKQTIETGANVVASKIPAFTQGPFVSRLSACSALYSDFYSLLTAGASAKSSSDYRALILQDNCLAKRTSSSRNKAWKELKARYLLDPTNVLFRDFQEEWRRCTSDQERALTAYCLLALNDCLVANLGSNYLFPRIRKAPAEVRQDDILAYLHASEATHPELKEWTRNTTIAVAQKYAASIRDFGLAKGVYKKQTVRPALYASPVRLLIRALRTSRHSDLKVIRSPWFRLVGLDTQEVVDALSELSRQGKLGFRMQADIVELDLKDRQR